MNVLLIAYAYPPHGDVAATRPYLLARHLARRGHRVTVIAADPSSGQWRDDTRIPDPTDEGRIRVVYTSRLDALARETARRLRGGRTTSPTGSGREDRSRATSPVTRGRAAVRRARAALRRAQLVPNRASWVPDATVFGLHEALRTTPAAIFVTGAPFAAFWAGVALKQLTGAGLVLDLRDPWSVRQPEGSRGRRVAAVHEAVLFRAADRVLFNTRAALHAYRQRFPGRLGRRFVAAPSAMHPAPERPEWPSRVGGCVPMRILYGGRLYKQRSANPLLQGFQKLLRERALRPEQAEVRLVGDIGAEQADPALLEELAPHAAVRPMLPYAAFRDEMEHATVHALIQDGYELSIPGKFYEQLATGKPILFLGAPDHELVDIVERELGVGVAADGRDPEAIRAALVRLQDEVLPRFARGEGPDARLSAYGAEARMAHIEEQLREAARQASSSEDAPAAATR